MSKTNKTFKNIDVQDLEYFNSLKSGKTDTETFNRLVSEHKRLKEFFADQKDYSENYDKTIKENEALFLENNDLKGRISTLETLCSDHENEIEKLKAALADAEEQKGLKLIGYQFVVDMPEELALKCRKVRKFLREENTFEFTEDNYPDKLACYSIEQLIKSRFVKRFSE